ncbi:hypothetical protein Y032_0476g2157 [Ancylostoma ceylanicum]|uniref:Uncharacterized protein n=1 Tax=Ancylostoma ceylanicum TaxID=53326 RepID=A0A016WWD0_9BILA|nr:hypothetical protein Y032_0476g2157 [Ancylostoma ceylanicum]
MTSTQNISLERKDLHETLLMISGTHRIHDGRRIHFEQDSPVHEMQPISGCRQIKCASCDRRPPSVCRRGKAAFEPHPTRFVLKSRRLCGLLQVTMGK